MSELPKQIGHYEVLAALGSGGMAEVYLGRHMQLGNAVAIKVLDARYDRDPSFRQRFVDEARIQANLKHPGILAVQDIIAEEDLTAIVMEYLEGVELSIYLKSCTAGLPAPQFLSLVLPLVDALAAAHDAGIVHRDIKPSNVFLVTQGQQVVPKLMDFGIAKLLDASLQSQQTAAGAVLGTPQFMAPEQFEDASTVDARADIFALGSMMYLLLARRLPFRGDGISEIMRRVLLDDPDALSRQRDDLPPGLERIVFRCLEKVRADRYQTMGELRDALEELAARVPPVSLEPGDLPKVEDRDKIRSKVGLASTTGGTLSRRSTNVAATTDANRTSGTTLPEAASPTTPSKHSMPAVRPEGSGGVILPGPGLEPRRKGRAWLWILLLVILGGAAAVGILWHLNRSEDEAPEKEDKEAVADVAEAPATVEVPEQSKSPRREAAAPSRAETRAPRGEWPALPAASQVHLGSRLHHPPLAERDRHLSALLALGWEGLEPDDLEGDDEAALGITASALAEWVRELGRTPGGRRLLPHVEKALAPFRRRGLKRSQLDDLQVTLGSPEAASYMAFQVRFQCETFRLVDAGNGDELGAHTEALLKAEGLTFETFQALKASYGKDPLLKAEIATRVLGCITGPRPE